MRLEIKQLGRIDAVTGKYLLLILACLLVSGTLFYDLNRRSAELRKLEQEVNAEETQIAGIQLPTADELEEWSVAERQLDRVMLADESVPLVFAEITRIGTENNLQRIGINTEEKTVPESPGTEAAGQNPTLLGIGVTRYSIVTIKFQGKYADTARFVDSVSRLPHAISIQSIDLRRAQPMADVTIMLHLYKRGSV